MFTVRFYINTKAEVNGDWKYTVNNGGITITKYNGDGIDVTDCASITIPTTFGGKPVTEIEESAFYQCYGLAIMFQVYYI